MGARVHNFMSNFGYWKFPNDLDDLRETEEYLSFIIKKLNSILIVTFPANLDIRLALFAEHQVAVLLDGHRLLHIMCIP